MYKLTNSNRRIHQTSVQLAGPAPPVPQRAPKRTVPNVPETLENQSHALSRASERDYHRLDLKVAAFVKMRDSVSFYRKILMSMYLRNQ